MTDRTPTSATPDPSTSRRNDSTDRRWSTRELLTWTTDHFRARNIDAPRVCAEMLLAHVIGCDRLRLYMEADRPASADERAALRDLVRRASAHEPVQYLVGHAWFFSRCFEVGPATLIPRPSTETLVELGVRALREQIDPISAEADPPTTVTGDATEATGATPSTGATMPAVEVLDLCTGTGCIAVSIAAALPSANVVATDLVQAAIELATRNATTHRVDDRIDFRVGALWSTLRPTDGPFDLICANPPYICDAEWAEVPPNVKEHEPAIALRAGVDGLDLIRPIVAEANRHLAPHGTLLVEIAASQGDAVLAIARDAGFDHARVERDHEGHDRVLVARRG